MFFLTSGSIRILGCSSLALSNIHFLFIKSYTFFLIKTMCNHKIYAQMATALHLKRQINIRFQFLTIFYLAFARTKISLVTPFLKKKIRTMCNWWWENNKRTRASLANGELVYKDYKANNMDWSRGYVEKMRVCDSML